MPYTWPRRSSVTHRTAWALKAVPLSCTCDERTAKSRSSDFRCSPRCSAERSCSATASSSPSHTTMAFANPPNAIQIQRGKHDPLVSPLRPIPPQPSFMMVNKEPSSSSALARLARIVGVSAAAAVTAAVAAPHLRPNRLLDLHDDTPPPNLFVQPAIAAAKFSKKSVSEKLSQVPVFAVTNASGQPYLAKMDGSGSQIGLIFFSHLDALNMLKDMQKNPGASDARVYIMGLDKAYEMVKAKPTPSGIRGSSGEELTMVFRFYPDSKQVKAAEGLQRKLRIRQSVEGVPVFVAKGLTLRKGNENVVPLFLTKEDLDAAWTKLRDTNKDLPNNASVVVGNLLYIIQQMENDELPELRNLGFFAPRASVEYVAKEQAGPTGQARLHQNPVNPQTK